jgi:hypothetical protein
MQVRVLVVAAVATTLAGAPCARAQLSLDTVSVTGTVRDATGGAIVAAEVELHSSSRDETMARRTDASGRFAFLTVPPGDYRLRVAAAGFTTSTSALRLRVGQAVDVPVALLVGDVTSTVDVTADTPTVDTRRAQVAHTVLPEEIDALPLNGRNYLDLALLAPGVSRTVQRSTERFAETSAVPGTGISVSGQRNLNNTFVVDGLAANDDAAGLAGTYFGQDVIREFQVITSGAPAIFGRAASGVVNIVTQSGGQMRRGRAYGYFRDDALDARNVLATREDPLSQRQYGGSVSGPLAGTRTYYFANVERTELERTGIVTIGPAAVDTIAATLARTGYTGPAPGTGEFPTGYDTSNVFTRVDHLPSPAARLSMRYSFYDVSSANARNVGGLNAVSRGTRLDNRDHMGAATLSTTGARLVNEMRGQVTRSRLGSPANDQRGPAVNIAGVASFGTSTTSPTARDLDTFELSEGVTLQRGAHLVTTGGNLVYERLSIAFPGATQGLYTFQSLAAFQEGRYVNFQQAFGRETQFQTSTNVAAFLQDEWRPRPSVTLNVGVRYDLQQLADPVEADANNVAPRLGVAFAPGGGSTVVRAAGGLYYDRVPLRAVSNALQRNGTDYRVALLTFGQAGAPVFPRPLAAFPAGILSNVTTIDPTIDSGVGRQFDMQVERQLGRRTTAHAAYVHLSGRQIIMSRNVNVPTLSAAEAAARNIANLGRPDPTVGNNSQYQSIGRSDYDGLTLSVRHAGGRWGSHRASYTLSEALDDAGNAFFTSPQNNFDVADDYGRSDNDQRHRLVLSGSAPVRWGMDLSYLFMATSAPPFNIQTGGDRNGDTTVNDRPAGVGRNTGEAFASATLDVRATRRFTIGRGHSLDVTLDAFNVLNRANYLIPNNVIGAGATPSPTFGLPTAAGDPRQLQLGLRWTF